VNKAITQGNKLDDPQGSIATYDELLERYGERDQPALQEQCAKALHNKGWIFGSLGDLPRSITYFDELLSRYGHSDSPTIQEQCQSALVNTSEFLLIIGQNEQAISRIEKVLGSSSYQNQESAIMVFFLWLAKANISEKDVLVSIQQLSPEVEFTWGWNDIRPLINKLSGSKKNKAECFIAYFEQHQNIAVLEACLKFCTEGQ
jgi:tetratricopeptide (TPR) repeat protein